MNIETIKLDPRIARIHYNDYRKRCRANRDQRRARIAEEQDAWSKAQAAKVTRLELEDQELLKAYGALCRGQQLLDVVQTVRKAGIDDKLKLPRLAICRANFEKVSFITGDRARTEPSPYQSAQRGEEHSIIPASAYPAEVLNNEWRKAQRLPTSVTALVPAVPAPLRPDDISKYFILWEAEWDARAPVDPLLLSRVNRTMFAVVAQWDLTPLEQRILEGRL
jgi:hypothetical protein